MKRDGVMRDGVNQTTPRAQGTPALWSPLHKRGGEPVCSPSPMSGKGLGDGVCLRSFPLGKPFVDLVDDGRESVNAIDDVVRTGVGEFLVGSGQT